MTPTQRKAMEQALEALDAMESRTPSLAETMRMQARAAKKLRAALAQQPDVETCEIPPLGWHCTRHAGHEGPCAAVANDDRELVSRAMKRLAEQPAEQEPVVLHQFHKRGCADWYDGLPDHEDGGGPYETRTLYTAPQSAIPPGYKLVPVEPTEAMCEEGLEDEGHTIRDGKAFADALYRAMLNAAPTPPAPAVEGEAK